MGHPNDVRKALLNAALRVRVDVALIRREHARLGDHRDLEPEVDEALRTLVAWAARVVVETSPNVGGGSDPPRVKPGPLAAKPRLRQPMRRTRR